MDMIIDVQVGNYKSAPAFCVDIEKVKKDLTFEDRAAYQAAVQEAIRLRKAGANAKEPEKQYVTGYFEQDGRVYVPRAYELPLLAGYHARVTQDPFEPERAEWPKYKKELWDDQIPACDALLAPGDKLLELGCGKGKTNIALWYAHIKGFRTLIVVDRIDLAQQWLERICGTKEQGFRDGLFDIKPRDVGRIYGGAFRVGQLVTIATIQTLAQQIDEYPDEFYDQFGLVIFDEAHVIGSPGSFSAVPPMFQAERLGLTATPERKDGLTPLMRWHFGGQRSAYVDLERDNGATWVFKHLPTILNEAELEACYRWVNPAMFGRRGKAVRVLAPAEFVSRVCEKDEFNDILVHDLTKAAQKGRNILVLGERVEHMHVLAERLQALGIDAAPVTSIQKRKARKENKQSQIILATHQLAGKGLDLPRLDVLFVLFPYDDVGRQRQEKGRIDRDMAGKRRPLVVTYCHDYIENYARKGDIMRERVSIIDPGAQVRHVVAQQESQAA